MGRTKKDQLKRDALDKLERLVKEELKYLEDTGKTLEDFVDEQIRSKFSEDEVKEISNSLESLLTPMFLYEFCRYSGIESKVLDNYKDIINERIGK